MRFRYAAQIDLSIILFWIRDKNACRYWAGPQVRFPASVISLAVDISLESGNSLVLEEHETLFAFGQILDQGAGFYHLARIIVAPEERGKGYGRLLFENLMQIAHRIECLAITLKVYRCNSRAHLLYQRLGFSEVPEISNEEICHMEKRFS